METLNLQLLSPFLLINSNQFYKTPDEAFVQYNYNKHFLHYNYCLGFSKLGITTDSLWVTNFNKYPMQKEFNALLTNNCKSLLEWYYNSNEAIIKKVNEYKAKIKTTTVQEQQVLQNIINTQENAFKEMPAIVESLVLYEVPKQNNNATTYDLGLKIMETLQPLKYAVIKKYEKDINVISDKDKDYINDLGNLALTYYNAVNTISDTTSASFRINYDSIINSYKQKITVSIDLFVAENKTSGYYQFNIPIEKEAKQNNSNLWFWGIGVFLTVAIVLIIFNRKKNNNKAAQK